MAGNIAERIDELLRERGISGSRMSADLGMSRAKSVTAETAARIAEYLGVSVDYLLGKDDAVKSDDPVERELAGYLEELRNRPDKRMLFSVTKGATKEQIEAIVHMIEELRSTK